MKIKKRELYRWQEQCLDIWFSNGGRGIVQAVTGSGKTYLAIEAVRRLQERYGDLLRVKIVAPTSEIMLQWRSALMKAADETQDSREMIGLWGGGFRNEKNKLLTVYVINSARYHLARHILRDMENGKVVCLIADECHHYASEQNGLIFEFLPFIDSKKQNFYSMGLTATLPQNENGRYLKKMLGNRIYHYDMAKALKEHTLCKYDIFHVELEMLPEEEAQYQEFTDRLQYLFLALKGKGLLIPGETSGEMFERLRRLAHSKNKKISQMAASYLQLSYQRKKLVCLASARIPCAKELIKYLMAQQEKIVVFGERIGQADQLYQELVKLYPGCVGRFHSQMGKQANRNTIERFRDGELKILITCRAIDEGIDIPDISTGIVLSGTSMQRQRMQRLGRVVRNAAGKEYASLYYLHLTDTSEEQIFLPDVPDHTIFEMQYDAGEKQFIQQRYDRYAKMLLKRMTENGADQTHILEAKEVLKAGSVRGDWRHPQSIDKVRKTEKKSIREKNYWICMNEIHRMWSRE